ncbi:MAG: ferrous iron transport protein B [Deltaproteobacteria bacterium]|nr:ferrous iron transport protein B [Deltaproteobacteria bacterium]
MSSGQGLVVALAGQPNCGKSTVFNALTGARQHIANYPGVTVEKKTGFFQYEDTRIELVDLPGTYSLSSFSLEERVARDFLLTEKLDAVVNVVDASSLKRSLYFTVQLLEMGIPTVVDLNMMDVAERRGLSIDTKRLSDRLGVEAVPTAFKQGRGRRKLLQALMRTVEKKDFTPGFSVDYGPLEPMIQSLSQAVHEAPRVAAALPDRWLAIKLLEGDSQARSMVEDLAGDPGAILAAADRLRASFESEEGESPERHASYCRYRTAMEMVRDVVVMGGEKKPPISDRVDRIVCHKVFGPLILVAVIYCLYYLAIVQGERLSDLTWDLLLFVRSGIELVLPDPGMVFDPVFRSFVLWFVDSVNSLLNYIPVFFILFSLIAILEDTGYMPRMAFMLDRLFQRFGLHGQSTLPMVLGGVYVGGCAAPGIMSCRGIPDERARLATILIIPMLNCLAKVPLYVLMADAFFPGAKGLAMFFISTVTLFMALPVAKILSMTVLKSKETAPFLMEMPAYHMPTAKGVFGVALRRVWLFIRKIATVVAAVAVILFFLLYLPGLSDERKEHYQEQAARAEAVFWDQMEANPLAPEIRETGLAELARAWERVGQMAFATAPKLLDRLLDPRTEAERRAAAALAEFSRKRQEIAAAASSERLTGSFLGRFGKALEPVTQWAGFNWRINVALASALAAKESAVATLGALYQGDSSGLPLAESMREKESGFGARNALALMLFMALYPPCMSAMMMIRLQTGSNRWMLFGIAYPAVLALCVSSLVFTGSGLLGLDGLSAMFAFWGLALAVTVGAGFIPPPRQEA